MRTSHRSLVVAVVLAATMVFLFGSLVHSQTDMENALKQYDAVTVKGYIQPLADLYGANINTGTFHDADIPLGGISIHLDLIGMGSTVSDNEKTYTVTLPASFQQRTTVQPTILGPKATLVTDPSGYQYKGSDGIIDASLFSHGVAQLTVGSIMGTEAFGRFFTTPTFGSTKIPTSSLYGGGLRHNLNQYLGELPVSLAAGVAYDHLSIGDLATFDAWIISAQASKSWGLLGLYGALSWEKSTMDVNYSMSGAEGTPVSVQLDGANSVRFTGGFTLSLAFIRIFADANVASITTFSGGIGFGN